MDDIAGDELWIEFDDGQTALYPVSEVRHLREAVVSEQCRCGHPRDDHHGDPGRGPYMASTTTETWACGCNRYEDDR